MHARDCFHPKKLTFSEFQFCYAKSRDTDLHHLWCKQLRQVGHQRCILSRFLAVLSERFKPSFPSIPRSPVFSVITPLSRPKRKRKTSSSLSVTQTAATPSVPRSVGASIIFSATKFCRYVPYSSCLFVLFSVCTFASGVKTRVAMG